MNRTQDTIILEKIFNERLELSIYKNRGQFYLTKNLRKQFRHKIEINIDVKNQKRLKSWMKATFSRTFIQKN